MNMEEKFEKGLVELVSIGMEGGLHTYQLLEIMRREMQRMERDLDEAWKDRK